MKSKLSYRSWSALPLGALLSTAAHASPNNGLPDWIYQLWLKLWGHHTGAGGGNAVPELDGAMGPLAVALLAGIVGIAIERRRRKLSRA